MSRRVTGYVEGKAVWSDDGPSYARVMGHGGSMVSGQSGAANVRRDRVAETERNREREKLAPRSHKAGAS